MAIAQPNTFSPDGEVVYVTTTNPEPEGCTVHALDAATGQTRWCRNIPQALEGSVEVDERLAALVPPPRAYLVHYHGVFAGRST